MFFAPLVSVFLLNDILSLDVESDIVIYKTMSSDQQKQTTDQISNRATSDSLHQRSKTADTSSQFSKKTHEYNLIVSETNNLANSTSRIYTGKLTTSSLRIVQQNIPTKENAEKISASSFKKSNTNVARKKSSLPRLHLAAKRGSLEKVKEILNSEPNLLNSR